MLRKVIFWLHLALGVAAGLFIFVMAATGALLSFERQMIEMADRGVRTVTIPNDARLRSTSELLAAVRRAGAGDPTAIALSNHPQGSVQFSIGREKMVYVDPYSAAVLGVSSPSVHAFFFQVERWHRALGAPLGSKSLGHWLIAVSNLLFSALILFGVFLWIPRRWNRKAIGAGLLFRSGLHGKAREWNWHNVLGIWCAVPLLIIALSGVVMSFDWANALLFRLTGSVPASARNGDRGPRGRQPQGGPEPDYDRLFTAAKTLQSDWRTITLSMTRGASTPVAATVDTGTGGQPQKRTQYLLNRQTGAVVKATTFADGSLGQRLRTFIRFGHTGEYGGLPGQAVAAIASLAACILVYTGLSLSVRRLVATLQSGRRQARQQEVSSSSR